MIIISNCALWQVYYLITKATFGEIDCSKLSKTALFGGLHILSWVFALTFYFMASKPSLSLAHVTIGDFTVEPLLTATPE